MVFDYFFLSSRFNEFAYQAEWLSAVSKQCANRQLNVLSSQYQEYRSGIAYHMYEFNKKTNSVVGWIKSFIPTTEAFNARKRLGTQMQAAKQMFLNFSIHYLQYTQNKKEEVALFKKEEKNKSRAQNPLAWKQRLAPTVILDTEKPNLSRSGMWQWRS